MNKSISTPQGRQRYHYGYFVFLALILSVLWAAVIWINRQAEQHGLEEMRRETAALALLFATHTDITLRTVDLALKELRNQADSPAEKISSVIAPHRELLSDAILQTGIVNAQGMVTYSTPIIASAPTYSGDREFFTAHQKSDKDTLFVGRPVKGRVSGQWSIHLSRPILKNGKFAGIVLIAVNPDYFVNFYQNAGLGVGGAARMIRDTGEVMARSSEQEKYIGKVVNPSPYADPGAPLKGSFRRLAQVDGIDRLSSYHRLPQYGLTVVIGPSVDERLLSVRSYQQKLLAAAGMMSLLILLIGFLIWQKKLVSNKAQLAIEKSEARFRSLFSSMSEGVALHRLVKDAAGHAVNYQFLDVNPAFELQTGLTGQSVRGKLVTEALDIDTPPLMDVYAEVARTGQPTRFEYRIERLKKDFTVHVFSPEPDYFATVFADITERRYLQELKDADHRKLAEQYQKIVDLQKQLQHQVMHDPLTRLHNRRSLDEFLPGEFARAKREGYPVSFIMLDLDHFKRVNDTYGHAFGDAVLIAVAKILKSNARESDLVCRFGGEEFLMVMPHMAPSQALQKVDAIRQAIADSTIEHAGITTNVTISAGVSSYPAHGSTADALVKSADDALYQAKAAGRNRVVVSPTPTQENS